MNKKQLNSKDLLLSFLYSPGQKDEVNEPIIGRTKLTKMMFLFEKEMYNQFFKDEIEIQLPDFRPYYFGPFSNQLFDDLAFFQSIGMIVVQETSIPISIADKVECEASCDEDIGDEWEEANFSVNNPYEMDYRLNSSGVDYVTENIWNLFSLTQKEKIKVFKSQINKISLDALLRYVYTKYPDQTTESIIAYKYLSKNGDTNDVGV